MGVGGWSILKGRWRGERRRGWGGGGVWRGGQWPIENKWLVSNRWGASAYTQGCKGSRAGDAHLSVCEVWCNLRLLFCACCCHENVRKTLSVLRKVLTNRRRARHTLSKPSNIGSLWMNVFILMANSLFSTQLKREKRTIHNWEHEQAEAGGVFPPDHQNRTKHKCRSSSNKIFQTLEWV